MAKATALSTCAVESQEISQLPNYGIVISSVVKDGISYLVSNIESLQDAVDNFRDVKARMALRDLGNPQDQLHGLPFVVPAEASNTIQRELVPSCPAIKGDVDKTLPAFQVGGYSSRMFLELGDNLAANSVARQVYVLYGHSWVQVFKDLAQHGVLRLE